jgi:nucleoside-diphosphate-sugar epimerase
LHGAFQIAKYGLFIRKFVLHTIKQVTVLKKILVTGAAGQLGTDLALDLPRTQPGVHILLTDLKAQPSDALAHFDYQQLDVTDSQAYEKLLVTYQPDEIYHLAALLSGTAEKNPALAWELNVNAVKNLLDICIKELPAVKLFIPSSIAVFGPGAGKTAAQKGYLDPTSMYGITKVTGEQMSNYYNHKYGLDVRSLRFPGLISSKAQPGGGTTDYSVEIYHAAIAGPSYTCYLAADTPMPFMYMPDALEAIHRLMATPAGKLTIRTSYNIHGFTATPVDFARSISKALGSALQVDFAPDFRQAIANSWPSALEDNAAVADWGWKPTFDIDAVTADMFDKLGHLQHS